MLRALILVSPFFFSPPAATDSAVPREEPTPEPKKRQHRLEFKPGVQAFVRGEGRLNPDFDAAGGTPDQGGVLERVRLQALAKYGPVSGFAQAQDARSWGFEAGTASNEANTDLHQGWMELGGGNDRVSGFVRAGRQEISIGNQRLIGPLAWLPNARSFDALLLHGEVEKFSLDLFGAMLQPPGRVTAPDPMDPMAPDLEVNSNGAQLAGLSLEAQVHDAFNAEILGLFIREDAKDDALTFDRQIGNAGARVWGEPVAGLSYDAEGNLQFGEFNAREHFAWAWAARLKYMHWKKRLQAGGHVGYAMASGDGCTLNAADGMGCGTTKSQEFFNFFPTNHMHYGLVDLMGWRNMRDLEASFVLSVPPVLKAVTATYHFFQLHQARGRWANAGGASVGAGWDVANDEHDLGHEIDLTVAIQPWKVLFIQPGYGIFIPVGAGRKIGGDDPQHFLWLWIVATF